MRGLALRLALPAVLGRGMAVTALPPGGQPLAIHIRSADLLKSRRRLAAGRCRRLTTTRLGLRRPRLHTDPIRQSERLRVLPHRDDATGFDSPDLKRALSGV